METLIDIVKVIIANYDTIIAQALLALGGLTTFFAAIYAIALIIPGEQPDKTIKSVLEFTKKFSKK